MKKFPSRPMFVLRTYEERNVNTTLSENLAEKLSNLQTAGEESNQISSLNRQTSTNSNASLPPPPPPLPLSTTSSNGTLCNTVKPKVQKSCAPPVPEKRSTLSFNQPPPCPTPDYDNVSIASSVSIPKHNGFHRNGNAETVEMESLESFELYSSTGNRPRPPDIYFSNTTSANGSISSGTSTLRKQRPVSVTIGEYGNGTMKKPGKLEFLQNCNENIDKRSGPTITSLFANELAQTLNRSNLKRRTESMPNSDKR